MACNCNNKIHCVETITVTDTNVALTVTNSTNISSLDCFLFKTDNVLVILWQVHLYQFK